MNDSEPTRDPVPVVADTLAAADPAASATPAATVVLDATALDRLRELDPEGRHGVVQRVLTVFETSLGRMQAQISAELPAPDPQVLKALAHTLKASSAAVGALGLAQCCVALERGLREGSIVDLPAQAQQLLMEVEAAQLAVRDMLRP